MSKKFVKLTKTYLFTYDELLEEVRLGSNNTGSGLEAEIFELAQQWIDSGYLPELVDEQVVSYR
jgi:hypothetical protein